MTKAESQNYSKGFGCNFQNASSFFLKHVIPRKNLTTLVKNFNYDIVWNSLSLYILPILIYLLQSAIETTFLAIPRLKLYIERSISCIITIVTQLQQLLSYVECGMH